MVSVKEVNWLHFSDILNWMHWFWKSKNTKIYDFFEDIFIMQKFQNSTQSKTLEPISPLTIASRVYRKKSDFKKWDFSVINYAPHENHVSGIRTFKPYPALAESERTPNFVLRQDSIFLRCTYLTIFTTWNFSSIYWPKIFQEKEW